MKSNRFQRIKEIFQAALKLDPVERTAFLDEACRVRKAGLTYRVKPCIAITIKGTGIMLSKVSCQFILVKTRVTPTSMIVLAATSGMAWAIRCSIKSVSLTTLDIN